ncbi:MAG TPA: hypothetical protein VFW50_21320 [Streptosporangiaceae bacterium]|nr:hypothetical protein [Streptosporangiaceae bacterium]
MVEVDERLGVAAEFDRDRHHASVPIDPGEGVEEVVRLADLDLLVAAHPLLAGQPLAPGPIEADPVAAEPDLAHAVAGRGPDGGAHVMRELRVDQRDGGSYPVAGPDRTGPVTMPIRS